MVRVPAISASVSNDPLAPTKRVGFKASTAATSGAMTSSK